MADVFSCSNYREFIHATIDENHETRGYQSRLAEAARCQRSFLSQVLNSHVHLTPDQAANLCEFWKLDSLETEYFTDLVLLERAQSRSLKRIVSTRLQRAKRQRYKVSSRSETQGRAISDERALYLSSWTWTVIHVLAGVTGQNTVRAISERLRMRPDLVEATLNELVGMGFVQKNDGAGEPTFGVTEKTVLLSDSSPLTVLYHTNLRQFRIQKLQRGEGVEGDICYSAIHALSLRDAARVKAMLMDAIKHTAEIVRDSPEEEVFVFCCDFAQL